MKTTIIVLVFFTYLTWEFNSVAVEENITVEVLIYSGRPNPTWKITDTNESQTLEKQLKDLQEISEQPSGWSTLGFQGFVIRGLKISGFSEEVRVFRGVVEVQNGKERKYLKDKNGIEQKLINASTKQQLPDQVKEAITKYDKSTNGQNKNIKNAIEDFDGRRIEVEGICLEYATPTLEVTSHTVGNGRNIVILELNESSMQKTGKNKIWFGDKVIVVGTVKAKNMKIPKIFVEDIAVHSSGQGNIENLKNQNIDILKTNDSLLGVANPSSASRIVQTNIIGRWVCLTNIPDFSPNKSFQYFYFHTDGSVEYKQQSGDNLVNKTESYKLIHKGSDTNCPGKNPNILITKNTDDTNGILLLDVSVDFDSRLPMKIGKVLKCSDIESNKYFFTKQDSLSKISGDQNELKVPYNEADKQRIIHLSGWFESKLIEILLDNKIIFKGILYPSDRTPQIKTVSIPSKTDARCELQIKIDNELIINYMITDRNLKKQTPLSVKDGILSIDWINGKIVSLSWNKQNKKIYVYQNDKIGYQ